MKNSTAHLLAAASPLLTVISQLIIKWQVNSAAQIPLGSQNMLAQLMHFLLRPWVILALALTFASGIVWILAMNRLPLSYAYPYLAIPFVLAPLGAVNLLGESMNAQQIIGITIIIIGMGIALSARS